MQQGKTKTRWDADDVVAFLDRAGLGAGEPLTAKALPGGYCNDVFRVRGDGIDWVVKRFCEVITGTLFPNLPEAEAAALERLDGLDVAPSPIAFFPDTGAGAVLVYGFHAGRAWAEDVQPVADAMRRQHQVAADGFREVPVTPEGIVAEGEAILAHARADAEVARLRRLKPTMTPAPAVLTCRALIHADAGAQNIIVGPQGLRIIDWQCPAAGDPAEDACSFVSGAFQILNQHRPLSDGERIEFLESYGDEAMAARLAWLEPAFIYRMTAYCILRMQTLAAEDETARQRYADATAAELARLEAVNP